MKLKIAYRGKIKAAFLALALGLCLEGRASQQISETKNPPLPKVKIKYSNQEGCSFLYSPVDFCDAHHTNAVMEAIRELQPNFNNRYILITIMERTEYNQKSIVAIDPSTGKFYPVPIDFFSGTPSKYDPKGENGKLTYKLDSNRLCLKGDIVVYRSVKTGEFCFFLEDEKFTGHHTTYMN